MMPSILPDAENISVLASLLFPSLCNWAFHSLVCSKLEPLGPTLAGIPALQSTQVELAFRDRMLQPVMDLMTL